jgi:predicted Zn-dependent protease
LLTTEPDNAVILNNLAWVAAQNKDPEAIRFAEKAYELAPAHPAVMDTLGVLLVQKGETARGLDLLRKASASAPRAPGIRLNLAKALISAGQKDAARKELDELTKLGERFSAHSEVVRLKKQL